MTSRTNFLHQIRQRERGLKTTAKASYFTPSLVEICAKAVADDFVKQPSIDHLSPELQHGILSRLSPSLPIAVTVPRVQAEDYWKCCCEARWSSGQLVQAQEALKGDPSWKRLFLERHLEDYLAFLTDEFPTTPASTVELTRLLRLAAHWVKKLHIPRLKCHLDVEGLIAALPGLHSLQVTYGVLNSGMQFDSKMYGIRPADCLQFASVLRNTKNLTSLSLPENQIDNDKLKALITGLVRNFSVTHLDLSHNRITDSGAKALATLLVRKNQTVQHLNLMDNAIRAEGGAAFGRSLSLNGILISLNLRLNRLGDEGGKTLFEGLRANTALRTLNIAHNELGAEAAARLCDLLRGPSPLVDLDVSGNVFGEGIGPTLAEAIDANSTLRTFDCRMSGVRDDDRYIIADTLKRRAEKPV